MTRNFTILAYTWNHQGIRIGETLDAYLAQERRNTYFSGYLYQSEICDFFPDIREQITERHPDIFIFGSQEDPSPGSYLHSHLLPEEMNKIRYRLLDRSRLMGVGSVSIKALQQGSIKLRGLRLSVYCRDTLYDELIAYQNSTFPQLLDQGISSRFVEYVNNSLTRNKGGLCYYLSLPNYKTLAIICAHLPHDAKSLIAAKEKNDETIRRTAVQHINICFNNMYQTFIKKPFLSSVIFMGDLNYRISGDLSELVYFSDPKFLHDLYLKRDELYSQMRIENIYSLEEGVGNQGPLFPPTCKMNHERGGEFPSIYNTGKIDQRFPSWADRILYQTLIREFRLECLHYNSLDREGAMYKSDHRAVWGFFSLGLRANYNSF